MKLFIQKYWPLFVIVFLWFIFSSPYFLKGLIPFPSDYLATFFPPWSSEYGMPVKNNAIPDVITQIYPWKKLTIDTWKSGAIPLWNPYSFSGTAHAGNYQTAVFSPLNLLFFVLPFVDAWSLLILLQPLLAGLLMYMFVRSLDKSKEGSLTAAIAFMFCGFIVVWMAYGTLGYAALFLPLIFWGIHKKYPIAVAVGMALSFLSGHFQVSLYVFGASLFFTIWKKEWRAALSLIFGALIAAPQIALTLHTFAQSSRGASILKGDVIPWQYLLTFLAPDFYGNPVTRNDWFGHYAEWAGFVGVAPLLLTIFAMVTKKTREGWFFLLLGLISLSLALPTPLNDLLYILKIPILSGSAASRIIILMSFSFSVLAAYGLDALREDWKHNRRKAVFSFAVVLLVLTALGWAVLLFGQPLPTDKLAIAKHNFVLPSAFIAATIAFFVIGLIRYAWLRALGMCALLLLSAFDVLRFAAKWMPFESREYMYPNVKSLTYLQTHVGNDRTFGNIGTGEVGVFSDIPLVEGYDAVYQNRYGEFMNAVSKGYIRPGDRSVVQFDKYGLYKTEALQLLGIKYIYHRFSDGHNVWAFPYWEYLENGSMHQVYSDEKYEIFEYNDVFPRAFLASSYVLAKNDQDILDTLFAKEFDRRNSLVLEESPQLAPQEGSGSAMITSHTPERVTIETDASSSKLLFLSDVYDSGWRATVDGKTALVYRADYDFRAVPVPAGKHVVVFRYAPDEFRWGIMATIAGIAGLAVLLKRK